MKLTKKIFTLLLASVLGVCSAQADDLVAFPGAAGWGRFAKGARATSSATVYHVTNLNDSGTGSLRDAVSQPNRIVVFDVAGIIRISSRIVFSKNLYVAGQTAPGEGVTVYGDGVSFSGSDNIIVRYMRFRMGSNGSSGKDCAGIANGQNMIFDHCSFSWGLDETFSINPDGKGSHPDFITLQNSIIGQGLMTHSAGGLIQSDSITLYRNLYIDNSTRNNKIKGTVQYVNNVVYNWKNGCVIMGGDSEGTSYVNIESNLFINGPANGGNALGGGNSLFHFYGEDNWQDSNMDGVFSPNLVTNNGGADQVSTPYPYPYLEKYNGDELLTKNIPTVGASLPYRDQADYYMIDELMSYGTEGNLISMEKTLPIGTPDTWAWYKGVNKTDTDGDGMPDTWENANGTNPAVNDATLKADNGYLNIENYINGITAESRDFFLRAPITLELGKATTSTLTLTWRDYTYDEEGFSVEVEKNGEWVEVGRTGENAKSFTIKDLDEATIYNVRVRAFGTNDGVEVYSEYSTGTFATRQAEVGIIDIDNFVGDLTLGATQTTWDYETDLWEEGALFSDGNSVLLNTSTDRSLTITDGVKPSAVVVNGTGKLTLNGQIAGTTSVNKANSGSLVLANNNTYTGATVNHEGTVEFSKIANGGEASSLGASIADAQNWIMDGGTFKYTGTSASSDRGARIIRSSALNIANSSTTLSMSGVLEGEGDLILDGPGTLSIADAKFFGNTGAVVINNGTLYLSDTEKACKAFSENCSKVVLGGGHLKFATQSQGAEDYQTCSVPVEAIENTTSQITLSNHGYFKGALTGAGDIQFNVPYLRSQINSSMSDFRGLFIANGTNSSWSLIYNSSQWNIPQTRVKLTGTARMAASTTNATNNLGGLSGDEGTYLMGSSKNTKNFQCVWNIGSSNSDETFNGIINDMAYNGTDYSGNGAANSIVKVGTGLWRLTANNTYHGTTKVNAGTLIVNGKHSGTGAVTVASEATLKGQGTLAAPVTIQNGGTLIAGDTIASGKVLTLNGAVTLASGATMVLPVVNNERSSYKQNNFKLGSTLTIGSGAVLEIDMTNVSVALEKNNYFTVFSQVPTSVTGTFTIYPETPGEGLEWDSSTLFTDGKLYIVAEGEGKTEPQPEQPKTYKQAVLYSWESPEGTIAETGGTASTKNSYNGADFINYVNSTYYTIMVSGKYTAMSNTPAENDKNVTAYIQIDLDEPLQAGDSIYLTAYQNKGTGAESSPYIKTGSTIINDGVKFNDIAVEGVLPNTRGYSFGEGCDGSKTILLSRGAKQGTNLFITKIVVTRQVEDTADGISVLNVGATNNSDALYNLSGQKVHKNYRGIVIKNGKKHVY